MSDLRLKLERFLLLLPVTFVVLSLITCRADGWQTPSAAQLVYLGGLATRLGLGLLTLLGLWAWLDARTPGRQGFVSLGLLLTASLSLLLPAADYLARSDLALRRGIPAWAAWSATLLVGLAGLAVGWTYQRLAVIPRGWHAVAGVFVLLLFTYDRSMGQSQAQLAPLVYGMLVVVLAVGLGAIPALRLKTPRYGALCLSLAVVGLALLGHTLPSLAARGRFQAHRTVSGVPHVDVMLYGQSRRPNLWSELPAPAPTHCAPAAPYAEPLGLAPAQRKNLIFITIDTVRADDARKVHDGKALMPALRRFMAESWQASHAYSAYPATMMSMSAAFTGLMPSRLLLSEKPRTSVFGALPDGYERLALFPTGRYFQRKPIRSYITQGTAHRQLRAAKDQTEAAIRQLKGWRKAGKTHALWVHYQEPHEPYKTHSKFVFGESDRERYWSELAHVDTHLGTLLDTLRQGGWYDDSLIFVFSDHGEAFGEHGQRFHHYNLYPWLLRVPFAVHVPGQAPRTLPFPVHLTDVAATALHFLGERPELALDGHSLLAGDLPLERPILSEEFPIQLSALDDYATRPLAGRAELERRARAIEYSQGYPSKISLLRGDLQWIVHRGTGVSELYDVKRDPEAQHNLAWDEPAEAQAMQRALTEWMRSAAASAGCRVEGSVLARSHRARSAH